MNIGGYTATGPREANEDNFYFLDFSDIDSFANGICAFAMVSDGMGGYQGGDVASGLAVACAKSYLSQLVEMAGSNKIDLDASAALAEIVQNAHDSILAEANLRGNLSMGATFVGAFVSRAHAWIGHVGDSRCYLVRNGQCQQLTEDHSHVGRMLSRGVITEKEAQNHPDRNRIERALGFNDARPDVAEVELAPGDALLLCSDGVYTVLDADALGSCVGSRDAAAAAERAVKLAIRRGTDDNSTAVVVENSFGDERARRSTADATASSVATADTQTGVPLSPTEIRMLPRTTGSHGNAENSPWKRSLPFVLAVALVGATGYLGIRGLTDGAQTGQVVPEEMYEGTPSGVAATEDAAPAEQSTAPEVERKPRETEPLNNEIEADDSYAGQPPAQDVEQAPEEAVPPMATDPAGYATFTIPEGSHVTLKYVDRDGTAQLFSYEPLALAADPSFLPGATVVAQSASDSYGRIGKSYQSLSDSYLDDLKRDISRYEEGSLTFDSVLSQLIEPSAYLAFVQELAQMGTETVNDTIEHLAIETLVISEQ